MTYPAPYNFKKGRRSCTTCKHYHRSYLLNLWAKCSSSFREAMAHKGHPLDSFDMCMRNVPNGHKINTVWGDILIGVFTKTLLGREPKESPLQHKINAVFLERNDSGETDCGNEGKFWTPSKKFAKNKNNLFEVIKNVK